MKNISILQLYLRRRRKRRQRMLSAAPPIIFASRPLSQTLLMLLKEEKRNPNRHYWDRVLDSWTDSDYKCHLRLTRVTFEYVSFLLKTELMKKETNWLKPISPECRLAICLWRLGSSVCYRTIGEHFGLGKSTVFSITMEVSKAIVKVLMQRYIKMPPDIACAALAFETKLGMPNCVGAIDGCHVVIPRPAIDGEDYVNKKSQYSIKMQALVDSNGRFLDVVIGWPGKAHDERIFVNSKLFLSCQSGRLFPQSQMQVDGVNVPYYIIGDSAYPLTNFLMKDYNMCETVEQEAFNKKLSCARRVVEQAFGRLKARWRCLLKRCDANPANARIIIAACTTLHNLCEQQGDFMELEEEFINESSPEDEAYEDVAEPAEAIRDALKDFLT